MWRLLAVLAGVTIAGTNGRAWAPAPDAFYIARHAFSDAIGPTATYARILDVAPDGEDVRVRLIRLSGVDPECPSMFVEVLERSVPHTTVAALARADLCSVSQGRMDRALEGTIDRRTNYLAGETSTIVATCAGRERRVTLPMIETIDVRAVERRDPAMADVLRVFDRVSVIPGVAETFPRPDVPHSPEQQAALTAASRDLASGRFQTAFGAPFRGPFATEERQRWPGPVELLERDLQFDAYVPIAIPPIALSMRLHGDVRLRLTLDRATGAVTDAVVVSGQQLLAQTAVNGVRRWRFTPGSLTTDQVEVTLRFEPRCG